MRLIAENFAQNIIYCIFKKPCPLLRRQDFLVIQYTAVHMLLSFCWDCMLTLHICLVKKKMSIFCRFLSMSTTNAPNKKTFKKEKDNKGWMGPNSVSTVLVRLYNCPLQKKNNHLNNFKLILLREAKSQKKTVVNQKKRQILYCLSVTRPNCSREKIITFTLSIFLQHADLNDFLACCWLVTFEFAMKWLDI